MEYFYYYENCVYKRVCLGNTPAFELEEITAKINMRFFQIKEWEKNRVKEEYMQCINHEVIRVIKTSNIQQLACKIALNNFATYIWPKNYIDKLIFPLKQKL